MEPAVIRLYVPAVGQNQRHALERAQALGCHVAAGVPDRFRHLVVRRPAVLVGLGGDGVALYDDLGAAPDLPAVDAAAAPYAQQEASTMSAQVVGATNGRSIRAGLTAALARNAAFLADDNISNADVVTQVKLLTRESNALIRLVLGLLSDASDT